MYPEVQKGTEFKFTFRTTTNGVPNDITGDEIRIDLSPLPNGVENLVTGTITDGPDGQGEVIIPSTVTDTFKTNDLIEFRLRRRPSGQDWIALGVFKARVV